MTTRANSIATLTIAFAFLAGCGDDASTSSGGSSGTSTGTDGTGGGAGGSDGSGGGGGTAPEVTGKWLAVDLGTTADLTSVFAPEPGLAFFGSADGMYRLSGGVVTQVDMGAVTSIASIDRTSGFAVGMEGDLVYAGVYGGSGAYAPFAWGTERNGAAPGRCWGNGSSFVYLDLPNGTPWDYHPTALFGGPSFSPPGNWGDLAGMGSHAVSVAWGKSISEFWVAGSSGIYRYTSNYVKESEMRVVDMWGDRALGSDYDTDSRGIYERQSNASWTLRTSIEVEPENHLFRAWFSDDPWVVVRRRDGGGGTTANPNVWGGVLLHVVGTENRRVDFPLERALTGIAVVNDEIYLSSIGGTAYRCRMPGCDQAAAAP
jgi:hypothetical protein